MKTTYLRPRNYKHRRARILCWLALETLALWALSLSALLLWASR
jgi:hypothetical protein